MNLVELACDESALDQRCAFGNRVESHAVYCHNDAWTDSPRKCRRTWYTRGETKDEDCPGFQPNPEFKGDLSPTPIPEPLCSACNGARIRQPEKGRYETCDHCAGEGCEPTETIGDEEENILSSGISGAYQNHAGNSYWYVYTRGGDQETESINRAMRLDLVECQSMTFVHGGGTAYLLKITGKGLAVLHLHWKLKEDGAAS